MSRVTLSQIDGFPDEIKETDIYSVLYNDALRDADKEVVINEEELSNIIFKNTGIEVDDIYKTFDILKGNVTKWLKLK